MSVAHRFPVYIGPTEHCRQGVVAEAARVFEKLLSNLQMTNVPLGPGGTRFAVAAAIFVHLLGLEVFPC